MTNVRVSCATVTVTESPDVHFLPECKCICHLVYSASVFAMVLALWSFGQLSSFFLSRAIICAAHIVCHILFRKMPTRRRPRRERRRTCALVGAPFDKCDGMNRHYCPFQYAFPPIWQSRARSLARLCLHCRLCSKSLAARRTCLPEDEEEQPNWFVLPPPPPLQVAARTKGSPRLLQRESRCATQQDVCQIGATAADLNFKATCAFLIQLSVVH